VLQFFKKESNILLIGNALRRMMDNILSQIKKRRVALGLKQHEISKITGIKRQQYQRLESKGNPRLDTLKLVAAALHSRVLLIPYEHLDAICSILYADQNNATSLSSDEHAELVANPWKNLLREE
jgi:transcriptional regulator with XRE-family HTH domain